MKRNNKPQSKVVSIATLLFLVSGVFLGVTLIFLALGAKGEEQRTFVLQRASELGVTVDDKLQVVDIEKDSTAYRAGIQPGDIIEKLGDTVVSTSNEAKKIVQDTKLDKPLDVAVKRNGQQLVLKAIMTFPGYHSGTPVSSTANTPPGKSASATSTLAPTTPTAVVGNLKYF